MKQVIIIVILFLCFKGQSQTSLKAQPGSSFNLDQYLWSFSKNEAMPNQKPLIDFNAIDNWRGLSNYLSVSDDGSYFAYTINKMVYNAYAFGLFKLDSLIIQSTKNGQRMIFSGGKTGSFTPDSRQYIFEDKGTLCFLQLGNMELRKIENITSWKISENNWLAYQLKDKDSLMLQNLAAGKEQFFAGITGYDFNHEWLVGQNSNKELLLYNTEAATEKHFSAVEEYLFAENGKALLIRSVDKTTTTLQYVSLPQGEAKTIWTGNEKTSIGNYHFDGSGKQVVFNIVDSVNATNSGIGYYEPGMDKSVLKISNQTGGIPIRLTISDASFTDNGHYLQVSLQSKPQVPETPATEIAGVEVWNHKDLYLQSAQSKQQGQTTDFNAIQNIETGKVVFLESDKKLTLLKGDFAVVKKDAEADYGDRFWGVKNGDSLCIFSLKDGSSKLLDTRSDRYWFSPGGNYLVYFDVVKGCHYFSCDLHTGEIKDISVNIPVNQLGIPERSEGHPEANYGNLAAWLEKDQGVLVYDKYDIWKLDLTGERPAVNFTNSFGQSNSTILSLFSTDRYSSEPIVKANETLLLRAFNDRNKEVGFYRKSVARADNPESVYMGDYFMNAIAGCDDPNLSKTGMAPVKAKNANSWIVQRQSTNDAPNYYETSDFKNFKRLTDFQPQKNYQWFTEELLSFKYLDGKTGHGILYKPENFDPNKKYPVLIAFYGGFSNNMYQFHDPRFIDQAMATGESPIWFLNNGFLVFTPDIAVAPLKYGLKAFSVIEGAAQYLKTLPYVDGNKLGIASHSWSAKLGAYIFTHSSSIAATAITEGFLYGNMINVALSTDHSGSGVSNLEEVENDFEFGNLWEHKDLWLDQTTVLNVDKAVGPLLLLCNKESSPEYQNQTVQFFTALRRLDKNVWWLKYDKGDHTLCDQKELQDYTIRYTQFFDHYLKNAPAPMWMTQGIPYKLKGIESRYELDPQGACNDASGKPCPICQAWNKQYKRTPEMFTQDIKDWILDKDIAEELDATLKKKRKELDKEGIVRQQEVLKMLNAK